MFVSTKEGDAGHNECFAWIHHNTPFSFSEAISRQGYVVEHLAASDNITDQLNKSLASGPYQTAEEDAWSKAVQDKWLKDK